MIVHLGRLNQLFVVALLIEVLCQRKPEGPSLKALCHAIWADCLLMKPDAPTR